jgi:hypothetical protein
MSEDMSAKEADRLMDWFLDNGYSLEEARACIKYIASGH